MNLDGIELAGVHHVRPTERDALIWRTALTVCAAACYQSGRDPELALGGDVTDIVIAALDGLAEALLLGASKVPLDMEATLARSVEAIAEVRS